MAEFWMDADAYIRSKNEHYAFDIAPRFWEHIDQKGVEGLVSSPIAVYTEIDGNVQDELAAWVRARRDSGLFVEPSRDIQENFQTVANHVQSTYSFSEASRFLSGADPWLIAHAMADAGAIVTYERGGSIQHPKIPFVANIFGLKTVQPFEMLRALGVTLS